MENHIIIYSQSLQNDDNPDLYFNGTYQTNMSIVPWEDIMQPLHKKQMQKTVKIENLKIDYSIDSDGYYLCVPSVEKDCEGRPSFIEIVCPKEEKNILSAAIKEFLAKSGRTLSAETEHSIEEILKKECHPKSVIRSSLNFPIKKLILQLCGIVFLLLLLILIFIFAK